MFKDSSYLPRHKRIHTGENHLFSWAYISLCLPSLYQIFVSFLFISLYNILLCIDLGTACSCHCIWYATTCNIYVSLQVKYILLYIVMELLSILNSFILSKIIKLQKRVLCPFPPYVVNSLYLSNQRCCPVQQCSAFVLPCNSMGVSLCCNTRIIR